MKSGWGDVGCLLIYIICDGEEALGSYFGNMRNRINGIGLWRDFAILT